MQSVAFETTIVDGIVRIPEEIKQLHQNIKATFLVMFDDNKPGHRHERVEQELEALFDKSNNKIQATMERSTRTEGMMQDGIL
jgi:hypothetical protein